MSDKSSRIVTEGSQVVSTKLVDMGDGTFADRVESYPPKKLLTDGDGSHARLRVDAGQTSFFAGREFRSFHEFSIAAGQTAVIKMVFPVNAIISSFENDLTLGQVRITPKTGGAEGGSFSTLLPVIPMNLMSTASGYTAQAVLSTGGTHSGGTARDIIDLISGSNANKTSVQSVSESKPVGLAAGTIYVIITNTSGNTAANGVVRFRWEERP